MIEINIDRIRRLLNLNNLADVRVGYDDFFSYFFLKVNGKDIHIFPGYNQNSIDKQDDFFATLLTSDCTAVVPVKSALLNSTNIFQVFDRPNLFTIDLLSDLNLIWASIVKKRQKSIDSYTELLRFEIANKDSPLVDVFVDLYINLQVKRAVPLVNFFDSVSLYSLIKSSSFKLFYAINSASKDSILFHLVRTNGHCLEYLFSANTDLESRNYSAYLHWHIIKWSKCELAHCTTYDLGGGIAKDDGVERFKREIGGIPQPRWYFLYPKTKYVDGEFFPFYASFLNEKNFKFS
jgi:hypothetical protein